MTLVTAALCCCTCDSADATSPPLSALYHHDTARLPDTHAHEAANSTTKARTRTEPIGRGVQVDLEPQQDAAEYCRGPGPDLSLSNIR